MLKYEQFAKTTRERDLKATLEEANERFEGLYKQAVIISDRCGSEILRGLADRCISRT